MEGLDFLEARLNPPGKQVEFATLAPRVDPFGTEGRASVAAFGSAEEIEKKTTSAPYTQHARGSQVEGYDERTPARYSPHSPGAVAVGGLTSDDNTNPSGFPRARSTRVGSNSSLFTLRRNLLARKRHIDVTLPRVSRSSSSSSAGTSSLEGEISRRSIVPAPPSTGRSSPLSEENTLRPEDNGRTCDPSELLCVAARGLSLLSRQIEFADFTRATNFEVLVQSLAHALLSLQLRKSRAQYFDLILKSSDCPVCIASACSRGEARCGSHVRGAGSGSCRCRGLFDGLRASQGRDCPIRSRPPPPLVLSKVVSASVPLHPRMGGRAETPGLFGGFFASSQAKVGFIRGASGTRDKLALRCTYTIDLGGCLDIPAAASPRRYHRSCRSHLVRSDGDSSTETNDVRDIAGPLTLSFLEPGREGGEERSLAQLRLRTPRDGRSRKRWEADREAAALDVHRECVSSFPSRCTPIRRLFDVGEYVTIEAVRTPAQAHPGDDEKETFCSSPSCTPSRAPCEPVAISRSSAGMLLSALSLAVTELQLQDRESLEDVCQQRLLSSLSQIKQDKELQRGDRVQTSVAPDDSSESSADSAGLTPSRAPKPMPWNLPVFAVMDADEELFLGSYIASASLYNQEFVLPCNQREPSSSGGGAAAEKGLEAMAERRNKGGETSPCAAGHKNANERDSHSRDGRKETFGATARAEDSPGWKRALSTRLTSLDELWHWEFFGFNVVRRKGQSVGLTGFFNYLACAVGLGTPPALLCPFDRRRQKALLRVLRERTRVSLRSTYFVAELPVRPSRPLPFPRSSTAAPSAASHERGAVGAAAHRDALEAEREGEWHSIWEFGLRDLWRSADFSDSEGELTQPAARCGSRRSQGSAAGGIDAAEEVSSDMREAWMTPREGEDDNAAARMNARDSGETPSLAALSGGASLGGSAAAHAGGFIHKDLLIRLSITGPDPYASLHFCRALPSLPLLSYRSTDSNAADLSCFTGLYDEQRGPLGPPGALPFVCTLRLTTQRHALERIRGLQCLLRAETPCFPPASGYSERDGLPQPPREKNLTERTRPQLRPQLGEEAQRSVGSRQGDGLLRGDDEEMNRTEGQTVLHAKGRFCSHLGFLAALAPLLAPIPPPRTPDGLFPFGPPSLAASPAAEADLRRSILSVLNPQQHEVTLPFPLTARLFGLSLLLGQALEISEGFLGADAEDRSSSDFPGKRRRDKPLLDETFSLAFPPTQSSESEQPPSHEGGPRPAFLQPRQLERPAGQHAPAGAYVCGRCEESEEEELSRADKPHVRRAAEIDCSSAPPLKGNAGALRSLARPTRGLSPQAASPVAACAGGQDEADTSPADGRHLGWSVAGIAKRAGRERVSRRAEEDTPARPPSAWAIPSPFCPPDSAGDRGAFSWVGGEIASAASQPSDGLCRGPSSGSGEEARMRRAVKRLLRPSHPDDHKAHLLRQARKLAVLAAIENGGDAGVSSRSGTTDAARAPKVPRGVPDDPHSGPACSASCPSPSSPHSPNRAVFLAFSLLCRGAPSNSLLTDLALAVAGLPSLVHVQRFWSLFLVALRGAWEARTLLPRVSSAAHPSPCPPGFQPQRAPCAGSAAGAQGSSSKARAPNAHGDRDATLGWEGGLEERNAQDSRKGRREDRGEFSPESKSGSPGHKSSWWRFSSSSLARTLSASLAVQTREGWNPASSLGSSHDSSHADLVATNALLSPSSGFFFDASGCNFSSPSPSPGRAAKAAAAAAVAAGASCAPDGPVGLPDFRGCLLLQHLQQLNCAIQQLRVLAWEAEGRPRSWAVGSGGGLRQAGASCGTRKDLCREERGGRAMLAGEDAAPLQSETQGEVGPFESHRFLAWTGQRTRKGEGVSEGRHRNPHDTGDPLPVVLPGMPPVTEVTLGLHRARLNAQKLLYIERNGGKRSGDSHETDLFPFARACRNAFERALTGYGEQLQGGASSPKGLHVRSSPLSRTFPSFSEWCVRELGPLLLSRCDLSAIADRQELLLDVRRAAFAAARQKSAQLLGASGATPPKKPVEGRLSEATRGHPARLSSPAGSREGVEDAAAGLEGEARIGRDAAASAVASAAALAAEETACEGLRVKQEEEEAQKNAHGDRVRRAERMWREAVHKGGRSKRVESRGPFFDAVVEGEMALHYLESISAVDLLQQLVCCLVTGAVETWLTSCACSLLDAAFGGLRPSLEETARKEAAVQTVACLAGCRHFLSASSTHMPLHSSSAAAASPRFPPCVFLPLLSAVLELQRQAVLQLAAAGSRSARDSLRASHEPMNRVSDAGDVFSPFAFLCTPAVFAAFLHCELTASRASSLLQKFDRYGENLPRASLGGVPLRGETLLGGAALQLSERVLSQHLRQAREAAGTAQSSRTERADPNRYSDAIELEGLGEDAEVPVLGKEEVSSVMFYVKDCQKAASGSWGPEEGAETPLDSPGDWWGEGDEECRPFAVEYLLRVDSPGSAGSQKLQKKRVLRRPSLAMSCSSSASPPASPLMSTQSGSSAAKFSRRVSSSRAPSPEDVFSSLVSTASRRQSGEAVRDRTGSGVSSRAARGLPPDGSGSPSSGGRRHSGGGGLRLASLCGGIGTRLPRVRQSSVVAEGQGHTRNTERGGSRGQDSGEREESEEGTWGGRDRVTSSHEDGDSAELLPARLYAIERDAQCLFACAVPTKLM